MLSYTNVDIEMHQFEISHIEMQRNRIELLKYYKTNIDKEFKRYDWHTFSNLIALNLNRIVLKTMNDSEISSMYLNHQIRLGPISFCFVSFNNWQSTWKPRNEATNFGLIFGICRVLRGGNRFTKS